MSEYAQRFGANAEQADYWNANAGPKWVEHQQAMDERMAPLTTELLARAAAAPGDRILDVGCGTGATTEALAKSVGTSGRLLAIDLSETMLSLARERCAGVAHVQMENTDAQVHAFDPGAFDLLISRFGVMFFTDPYAAFANLGGALRAGGRLCFVCWAPMDRNPWFQIPLEAAKRHIGPPDPTPPRAPGPLAFSEPAYVEDILNRAGFLDIGIDPFETTMGSAAPIEEQAQFFLTFGPAARLIAARQPPADVVQATTADIAEALRGYHNGSDVTVPATVYYVSARRP